MSVITHDGKKWHYLAVKSISTILRGITSNNHGDFSCLKCLHPYRIKGTLKKHEKVCNNYDYCFVKIPNKFQKNIKIQPRGKIIESSFCDLC